MTNSPVKNATLALGYILLIASVMQLLQRFAPKEDNFLMPVAFLSLLTLSAAIMGFLFLKAPLEKYWDGDKKGGLEIFLKTIGCFAALTVIVFILMFFAS